MPMGPYKDFSECRRKVAAKHEDWSKEKVKKYCGKIYWQTHKNEGTKLIKEEIKQLREELNDK